MSGNKSLRNDVDIKCTGCVGSVPGIPTRANKCRDLSSSTAGTEEGAYS